MSKDKKQNWTVAIWGSDKLKNKTGVLRRNTGLHRLLVLLRQALRIEHNLVPASGLLAKPLLWHPSLSQGGKLRKSEIEASIV